VRMSLLYRTRASRRDAVMLEGREMARVPLRLRETSTLCVGEASLL